MSSDIKHHIKVYRNVFLALLVLTGLTVGASYVEFGGIVWLAVGVGVISAIVVIFFSLFWDQSLFVQYDNHQHLSLLPGWDHH